MTDEIDAMGAMIGSILSFARDDAKREPRTLVDLDALVEGVCEDASDAGGAVAYTGDPRRHRLRSAGGVAPGDLQPVDNAVKYGGGAEVTLTAEAGRRPRGRGSRARHSAQRTREGFRAVLSHRGLAQPRDRRLGLGLAVARSIAREHGGDIVLAARKGGGLSARLELPA